MNVSLRLYKEMIQIPTSYLVGRGGFYFQDAPLEIVRAEQTRELRQAILAAIGRGNPPITRDEVRSHANRPDAPMLKAAGTRSWHTFDRQTKGLWNFVEKDGIYQIRVDQPMKPRGWHEDKTKRVEFPLGTPIDDVIDRLIAMIQERAKS